MQRTVLSVFFLLIAAALLPRRRRSSPQTSGDPAIDAQWVQLASSENPVGSRAGRSEFARRRPASSAPSAARGTRPPPRRRRRSAHRRRGRSIDPAFLPRLVDYPTSERPGTIVIDTSARYLYVVLDGGKAQRYGVGVGREGFGWKGSVHVGRKAEWPTWTPPAEMRIRQPYLPVSMEGGPEQPARRAGASTSTMAGATRSSASMGRTSLGPSATPSLPAVSACVTKT